MDTESACLAYLNINEYYYHITHLAVQVRICGVVQQPKFIVQYWSFTIVMDRDGFRVRGALDHLSFWGPTQV